jgi:hypothetical protein
MADRYQRGTVLPLGLLTAGVPDHAPIAVILGPDSRSVLSAEMYAAGASARAFRADVFLDSLFALGVHRVAYSYTVGGVPQEATDAFEIVSGGDSGGDVIALYGLERPERPCVVAQLGCGRLVLGRRPALPGAEDPDARPEITF